MLPPMLEGKTLCITGGAGFIGTALVRRLAENNQIRVFDILRRNALGEAGLDTHPNELNMERTNNNNFRRTNNVRHSWVHFRIKILK